MANGLRYTPPPSSGGVDPSTLEKVDETFVAIKRDKVLRILQSTSSQVGITKVSSTQYRLYSRLTGQFFWRVNLTQLSGLPGSTALHQLSGAFLDMPWLSIDHLDGSVSNGGTGWTTPGGQATYGGTYRYTVTPGSWVQFTSPAGVTRVGMRTVAATNGGIVAIDVDTDSTKANLLPTAQQLVDRGQLAPTALTTGGGTLAPTQRVLDLYSQASNSSTTIDYDRHFAIADNLAAGVHTVRATATGYQNVSSSASRLFDSGWTYATVDTTIETASMELLPHTRLQNNLESAYEYAHEFTPSGGSTTFLGNVHGYDAQSSLTIWVDGIVHTPADGVRLMGQSVEIQRVSKLTHPSVDAGATTVADVITHYTVTSNGLTVSHRTVWQVAGSLRKNYPAMFPLDGRIFTKGSLPTVDQDFTFNANNDSLLGGVESDLAYVWEDGGRLAAALFLPDTKGTVNDFINGAAVKASIEDRSPPTVNTGDLTKIYMTRSYIGSTEAVVVGDEHISRALYRVARLPDTAALER